jgi:hypothetical protein
MAGVRAMAVVNNIGVFTELIGVSLLTVLHAVRGPGVVFKGNGTGNGGSGVPGLFALGRWGLPLNLIAVSYQIVMIVNIAWPRRAIYNFSAPFHWYLKWGGVLFPLVVALIGAIYYVSVGRNKTVLAEHAAHSAREATGETGPTIVLSDPSRTDVTTMQVPESR